jgi:predicted amidophosphoribosyltransferase
LELLEGAFSTQGDKVEGQDVLLFDDLYRSGATMNATTSALLSGGQAANVYAFALPRTRSAS